MTTEKANYVTCPEGHKVFVIWSPLYHKYGFTCDECDQHSFRAIAQQNNEIIEIRVVARSEAA